MKTFTGENTAKNDGNTLSKLHRVHRPSLKFRGGICRYIEKDGHAGTDRRTRTDGHGHADTKDGQLWKRRALMEKTDSYGKDGHLWKRRTLMEKTGTFGKDGHLWKRRPLMEKTGTYGKDGYVCIYFELNAKCKRNNNNTNQRYGFPELPDASVGLY